SPAPFRSGAPPAPTPAPARVELSVVVFSRPLPARVEGSRFRGPGKDDKPEPNVIGGSTRWPVPRVGLDRGRVERCGRNPVNGPGDGAAAGSADGLAAAPHPDGVQAVGPGEGALVVGVPLDDVGVAPRGEDADVGAAQ